MPAAGLFAGAITDIAGVADIADNTAITAIAGLVEVDSGPLRAGEPSRGGPSQSSPMRLP